MYSQRINDAAFTLAQVDYPQPGRRAPESVMPAYRAAADRVMRMSRPKFNIQLDILRGVEASANDLAWLETLYTMTDAEYDAMREEQNSREEYARLQAEEYRARMEGAV